MPGELLFSSDGTRLYIFTLNLAQQDNPARVYVVDTTRNQIISHVDIPLCGIAWIPTSDQQLLTICGERVLSIDPATNTTRDLVDLPPSPDSNYWASIYSPALNQLFVLRDDASVQIINLTLPILTSKVNLPIPSGWVVSSNSSMTISPDGTKIYIGSKKEDQWIGQDLASEIWVFETKTWQQIATIRPNHTVFSMAISSDGRELYAVNPWDKTLSFIDTTTNQEIVVLSDVGNFPSLILTPSR